MPKVSTEPEAGTGLRPFVFHGVDLGPPNSSGEAVGECPFCGKAKFHVNAERGLWGCKVCGKEGNPIQFLRQLWEAAASGTGSADYDALAESRGLTSGRTVDRWGVVRSPASGEWLVPGFGSGGKLDQLYRYAPPPGGRKPVLQATPTLHHALFGADRYDRKRPAVYVAEGPWDGMALEEALRGTKRTAGGLRATANEEESLYAGCNVVAVPGANVWKDEWTDLFAGKVVTLLYDSDLRTPQGQDGAGLAGMKRFVVRLGRAGGSPKEVRYVHWGVDGHDPTLSDGYDVRDALTAGKTARERTEALAALLERVRPVPAEWGAAGRAGSVELKPGNCTDYRTLQNSWRKALRWTPGLDLGLSIMLASIVSTKTVGDQLWIRLLGPPATGKSTLCEALSVARKYVVAKSTIRGLSSGYQSDREGKEDNSLIPQIRDKTLIIKDGDTLLQSPNLGQILSEIRDVYDRVLRSSYKNKRSADHEAVDLTIIISGTHSLRTLDTSELGERFLTCDIMQEIDSDLEDEILARVAHRSARNVKQESNGTVENRHDSSLTEAMRLTGGYVEHLRRNAADLLTGVELTDAVMNKCITLGKLVSYSRARPSLKQDESTDREFATRLVSQMVRLSACLAAVMNRKEVDDEVMGRVVRVALDTAKGRVLDIFRYLREQDEDGATLAKVCNATQMTEEKERPLLRFLKKIKAIEDVPPRPDNPLPGGRRFRLTATVRRLYDRVQELVAAAGD